MHFITWLGYRTLFNSASPTRRARNWEPKVDFVVGVRAPTVRTGGVRDEISRFSYPRDFSNNDLITVNMWVVTSFVIEVFPSIVSDL